MVQINWTSQAFKHLKDIAEYIGRDSTHYAKLQILRLKTKPEILKKQLYYGSIVPEYSRKDLRQLIEGR